ncbi:MAG: amidohydrolase family protein [Propylenella sp.]
MNHSVIDTKSLGEARNRYGPTVARDVRTDPIRLKTTTVDSHAHVLVPEAAEFIKAQGSGNMAALPFLKFSTPETRETNLRQDEDRRVALTDPADRIRVLDRQCIDMQVVAPSPNQSYYEAPREHAAKVSRLVNEGVAAFVATNPRRFAGLGTIPLQAPEIALGELEHVMKHLGFRGVQVLTNVNGKELSSPEFEPIWANAAELGAVMMLHPMGFTEPQRLTQFYFTNTIGNPFDTTLALHNLIMSGVLERHPDLKIYSVHGGGFLPCYSGRIDHAWGARRDANGNLPRRPTDYLRKIYFDTTVFTPHQLEYLVRQFGADHIVMGTDYPYDMAEYFPLDHVTSVKSFSADEIAAVAGGTAMKLFGLSR